jgi:hypothetical protein
VETDGVNKGKDLSILTTSKGVHLCLLQGMVQEPGEHCKQQREQEHAFNRSHQHREAHETIQNSPLRI